MNRFLIFKSFVIPVFISFLMGYFFLHPASVLIFYIFEKNSFDMINILKESFSPSHFAMGFYFSVIGGFLGGIITVYFSNLKKTNSELYNINSRLKMQNSQLQQKASSTKINNKLLLQKIWPALNKIENGVDMVTSRSTGNLNKRQSVLLSITQGNIERLYEVIESLVLGDIDKSGENDEYETKIEEIEEISKSLSKSGGGV